MRAYQVTGGGIEGIVPVELPDPSPGPGELLIRVRATSLNYRDLLIARRTQQPLIPLSDGAGEVIGLGEGVTGFAVGDRVAGCFFLHWPDGDVRPEYIGAALGGGTVDGMLAELVVLPAGAVVRLPDALTDAEAATLPCAAVTAWNALFVQARLRPGESVLLLGTGGVSIAGMQLARLAGLRAIITSSSDAKLERARALGADAAVNYRTREDWDRAVLELTDGRGVDLVLEVGGAATFPRSMAATRLGGALVLIGALAHEGADPGTAPLVGRNIRATRVYVGSRVMFEDLLRAQEFGQIRPVIDRVFDFDEAAAAYRYLESQAHVGKVVIQVA